MFFPFGKNTEDQSIFPEIFHEQYSVKWYRPDTLS